MQNSDLQLTQKYRGQLLIGTNGTLRFTAAGREHWGPRFSQAGISIHDVTTAGAFREAARRALQAQIGAPPAQRARERALAGPNADILGYSNPVSDR